MSGEPVRLPAAFEPLLHAAAKTAAAGLPRFALVGGFAVAARLAQAAQTGRVAYRARATTDVDGAACGPPSVTAAEHLAAVGVGEAMGDQVLVDGIKVETIEVSPIEGIDTDSLDDKSVLFVVGHWYASGSGEPLRLMAGPIDATVPVATVGGLVATKLHAALDRGRTKPEKLASDVRDVHHLIDAFDGDSSVSDELARQRRLGEAVANTVDHLFINDATRSARAVQVWGDPTWGLLSAEELRSVGEVFVARLRSRLERATTG